LAITIRTAVVADAAACGVILYRKFQTFADRHNFPPDFPSVEVATGLSPMLLAHPGFYGVVAEDEGRIVGSNFADQRSSIAGIGPISVDPMVQNRSVGRSLMQAVVDHFAARNFAGIRLIQASYHNRSLCLYTKLGFRTREPPSVMQGLPLNAKFPGYEVRPATKHDITACHLLCRRGHGFNRGGELSDAIDAKTARVVEHMGRIAGYAGDIAFFAHAVAETNQGLEALIGAAPAFPGPGFLLPTRNHELFEWCLDRGLRLVMKTTLMTLGLYDEPAGAYLPSILMY